MTYFASHPAAFELTLLLISIVAGIVGAVLGLGGGVIVVPALALLFGVDIHYAVGAGIVSAIATSSGAAATYVKDHITNIRVAMLLEVGTSIGALTGALLAAYVSANFLFLLFAALLFYSALMMLRGKAQDTGGIARVPDPLADKLRLHGSYPDAVLGRVVEYQVTHVKLGVALMFGAGLLSALLGIGSGSLKVPAMDRAMGLPIKVSSATSNFMIGVTAAASAGTYYMGGFILPSLAAPVALGVIAGSWIGTRIMVRLPSAQLRKLFTIVLFLIAIQMAFKALGVKLW